MNNTTSTTTPATSRSIKKGTDGSGYTIWIVCTVLTLKCGAERIVGWEKFTTHEEAENWIQWA